MQVASLHVYPVKSCQGVSVTSAAVSATGFSLDRIFCIVDETHTYVTQRENRVLAKIATALSEDERVLTLTSPAETGLGSISLALGLTEYLDKEQINVHDRYKGALFGYDAELKQAKVVSAYESSEAVSSWITSFVHYYARTLPRNAVQRKQAELLLAQTFKIVRIDNSKTQRLLKDQLWGDSANSTDTAAFQDWSAFHITTEESLADVNMRLEEEAVGMERFRPNIVLKGAPCPFAEEGWGAIEFGAGAIGQAVALRRLIDCPRCIITTTDQKSGDRHPKQQPRKGMLKLAKEGVLGKTEGPGAGPNFGVYAGLGETVELSEAGVAGMKIRVGQSVTAAPQQQRAAL
jgi:uncharacterized protein YcbX